MKSSNQVDLQLTTKQLHAFNLLTKNNGVNEVVYGGAAGGGKSFLGSLWVVITCLQNPNVRMGVARSRLVHLKKTTFVTIRQILTMLNVNAKYDDKYGVMTFPNGSEIVLIQLKHRPNDDPDFQSLGSLNLSGVFVDEFAEVTERSIDILRTRIRENMPTGEPKLLLTCNPSKNWVKQKYYDRHVTGTLEARTVFIQALPTDNPFLPKSYIDNMQNGNRIDVERLLLGNWNYADEDNQVFKQDYLDRVLIKETKKYELTDLIFTIDVASGTQNDRSVLLIWKDLDIIHFEISDDKSIPVFGELINKLYDKYKPSQIVVDADGMGIALVQKIEQDFKRKTLRDAMSGKQIKPLIYHFHGNGKSERYKNLKEECVYKMSENQIFTRHEEVHNHILKEFPAYRTKQTPEGNIVLFNKEEQKRLLGYSPDIADACMMRFAVYNQKKKPKFSLTI